MELSYAEEHSPGHMLAFHAALRAYILKSCEDVRARHCWLQIFVDSMTGACERMTSSPFIAEDSLALEHYGFM